MRRILVRTLPEHRPAILAVDPDAPPYYQMRLAEQVVVASRTDGELTILTTTNASEDNPPPVWAGGLWWSRCWWHEVVTADYQRILTAIEWRWRERRGPRPGLGDNALLTGWYEAQTPAGLATLTPADDAPPTPGDHVLLTFWRAALRRPDGTLLESERFIGYPGTGDSFFMAQHWIESQIERIT